ncbi:MAG: 3,4-dihydroxy-2-butanone-4-phosphate synthase [Candidatus Methanospirareceae archaeon]
MIPASVREGIERIRKGELVLIYDADDREGETDFAMPASFVTARDVANFRKNAGGLICVAIHPLAAERLGLPFISDVIMAAADSFPTLKKIVEREGDVPYDKRSSFSLWVNHRDTFTGITDKDRALTIRKIGEAVEKVLNGASFDFGNEFRTPGHVSILKAADGLLEERNGQTELSVALAMLAGVPPAMVICEMLDEETGNALSKEDAKRYAAERGIVFIEGKEIKEAYFSKIGDG